MGEKNCHSQGTQGKLQNIQENLSKGKTKSASRDELTAIEMKIMEQLDYNQNKYVWNIQRHEGYVFIKNRNYEIKVRNNNS